MGAKDYTGTHFTCFTGTKVQKNSVTNGGSPFSIAVTTGGEGLHRKSLYLFYWDKSTNTDAAATRRGAVLHGLQEAEAVDSCGDG